MSALCAKRDHATLSPLLTHLRTIKPSAGMLCAWSLNKDSGDFQWTPYVSIDDPRLVGKRTPNRHDKRAAGMHRIVIAAPKTLTGAEREAAKEVRRLERNWRKADARRRRR